MDSNDLRIPIIAQNVHLTHSYIIMCYRVLEIYNNFKYLLTYLLNEYWSTR